MAFPTEPLALVFYASILISIGISIFLAWKADLKRQDWVIYGAGILLAVIFGALGYTGQLSTRWELALGYWPGLLTYSGAPKIAGIIPYGLPGPIFFAIGFLWLARSRWGGDVGRYFEIVSVGLFIQLLTYVPHLSWHLKAAGKGPQALPAWGMSSNFWYVFWHGAAAMSFAFIAYGFYLYWQSTE